MHSNFITIIVGFAIILLSTAIFKAIFRPARTRRMRVRHRISGVTIMLIAIPGIVLSNTIPVVLVHHKMPDSVAIGMSLPWCMSWLIGGWLFQNSFDRSSRNG